MDGLLAQMNPEDPAVGEEETAEAWRRMREAPGRCVLVAIQDGRAIGTADCIVIDNLTRGARPFMIVENVVVDVHHRRRRVGQRLLDAAVERARNAGCYKVQLLADDTDANRRFYTRCGLEVSAQGFKRRL